MWWWRECQKQDFQSIKRTRMARRWQAARARRRSPPPALVKMPRSRRCSATRLMACSSASAAPSSRNVAASLNPPAQQRAVINYAVKVLHLRLVCPSQFYEWVCETNLIRRQVCMACIWVATHTVEAVHHNIPNHLHSHGFCWDASLHHHLVLPERSILQSAIWLVSREEMQVRPAGESEHLYWILLRR